MYLLEHARDDPDEDDISAAVKQVSIRERAESKSVLEISKAILHARVPLLNVRLSGGSRKGADITLWQPRHEKVSLLLNYYCDLDPRIRPYLFALKSFGKNRGLSCARVGTLSGIFHSLLVQSPIIVE
jgi:DNA polymerase sigma